MSQYPPFFFADDDTQFALKNFVKNAENRPAAENKETAELLRLSHQLISSMANNSKEWDDACSFNKRHIGGDFIRLISQFNRTGENADISAIYVFAYRFLCEFYLNLPNNQRLSPELSMIHGSPYQNMPDGHLRVQMHYAQYGMPVDILKELINNENILSFRHFDAKSKEAAQFVDDMVKEREKHESFLASQKAEVEKLANTLNEQKDEFNFVGLHKGFADLGKEKVQESKNLRGWLIAFGVSLLVIPGILLGFRLADNLDFGVFLPLASAELILIYFFRIILLNYKSAKSQIMQIELRMALCRFIQKYAEYAGDIEDKTILNKFENVIFSAILPNPEKLPSTFDGMEQIKSILKETKDGK